MVRKSPRELVLDQVTDSLRITQYNTGAAYFQWEKTERVLFSITNAQELSKSGYLDKIASLLVTPEAVAILSKLRGKPVLEFHPQFFDSLCFILDSKTLGPERQLVYMFSFLFLGVPLTPEGLQKIFTARDSAPANYHDRESVIAALTPNGVLNGFNRVRSSEDFFRRAKLVSFYASPESITYGNFLKKYEKVDFIPCQLITLNEGALSPVSQSLVEDLYPAELLRFQEYFASAVPSALKKWSRQRFDNGVVPMMELRSKEKQSVNTMWEHRLFEKYLTFDEMGILMEWISSEAQKSRGLPAGWGNKVVALLCFYLTEAGPQKFEELLRHILENSGIEEPYGLLYSALPSKWNSPYGHWPGKKTDYFIYVKAMEQETFADAPLEWTLMTM